MSSRSCIVVLVTATLTYNKVTFTLTPFCIPTNIHLPVSFLLHLVPPLCPPSCTTSLLCCLKFPCCAAILLHCLALLSCSTILLCCLAQLSSLQYLSHCLLPPSFVYHLKLLSPCHLLLTSLTMQSTLLSSPHILHFYLPCSCSHDNNFIATKQVTMSLPAFEHENTKQILYKNSTRMKK